MTDEERSQSPMERRTLKDAVAGGWLNHKTATVLTGQEGAAVSAKIPYRRLQELAARSHPHMPTRASAEPGPWDGEIIDEARAAHHLLDEAGIPIILGMQGPDGIDARVHLAVAELIQARARLARIAAAHHKHVDAHGGTWGECAECGERWPCPTHVWATDTERHPGMATWDPADDEVADRG